MRCIIKTLKSRILPIFLSLSLVLGSLFISGASAYEGPETNINELYPTPEVKETLESFMMTHLDWQYLYVATSTERNPYFAFVLSDNPFSVWYTNGFGIYSEYSDSHFFIYACSGNLNYINTSVNSYYRYLNPYYLYYNSTGMDWLQMPSVYTQYASFDCFFTDNPVYNENAYTIHENLVGLPWQDQRIFEVWKSVEYPESNNPLEYIYVRLDGYVDLNKISTQKIRFDYIDQDGNSLYKVFSESDFHDIQYDSSDDLYTFYIFPYLISSYEFTITSATYYADNEWAEKTIELDLTFNEGTVYPLPQDWNSVYTVNQYFQSRSNGTVNGGVTKLALSDTGYLWIDYYQKVCHQSFDVKVLFIPYFMNSDLLSINLETLFQLFEQYDVIFTGVQSTQFNLLIPTLDYNDLFTYYSQNGFYPALKKLQEAFVFYSNLGLNHDFSDYTWSLSTDEVGFIVTRSFLLKRTLTALGDIDDRLLEFETNLFGEDSLGPSLQTKLDNILSLEHDFFTDVSNFFQKLEYNLNGLSLGRIEKYLEDIWSATVGERNFNYTDLLPEPLKSIFLYFRGWFISSTQYMQDFIDVSNSSLYGDDLMTLPFEASVVPVLPFEPGTPTPIPIPTLEAGLIEVGGD